MRSQVAADAVMVDAALARVEGQAQADEDTIVLTTPDADLNRAVNRWHKKQITWQTRLWRNGMNYPIRNILQDAVGYALYQPEEEALKPMRTVTAMQKQNGYVKVWTTRPGEVPTIPWSTKCMMMAGSGWLSAVPLACMRLVTLPADEVIPFVDGGEATWYEHLLVALRFYDTNWAPWLGPDARWRLDRSNQRPWPFWQRGKRLGQHGLGLCLRTSCCASRPEKRQRRCDRMPRTGRASPPSLRRPPVGRRSLRLWLRR